MNPTYALIRMQFTCPLIFCCRKETGATKWWWVTWILKRWCYKTEKYMQNLRPLYWKHMLCRYIYIKFFLWVIFIQNIFSIRSKYFIRAMVVCHNCHKIGNLKGLATCRQHYSSIDIKKIYKQLQREKWANLVHFSLF